ncbi:MAG: hypothetical protein ABSF46_21165 [Terriglobia bacterium]|jgi:hypothetical protein
MTFYAFRLDLINVKNPRGKLPDEDIVTFSVLVNQVDRGHGAGLFVALVAGAKGYPVAVPPTTRQGMSNDWIVGPLEIAPGDTILVVYSGTNTSDEQLDLSWQAEIEIKVLDAIASAAAGAIGGAVSSVATTVLGILGDPIGKALGYSDEGPCNGLIFSDAVSFSGSGLDSLAFHPRTESYGVGVLQDANTEFTFTRPYTDQTTHNSTNCGAVANYEITFSVLRVPTLSVRRNLRRLFPGAWENGVLVPDFSQGLRQLAPPKTEVSLRRLLGLLP